MNHTVDNKVEQFFADYPLKSFRRKQIIIFSGEKPPGIFYLKSGQVRQYDITHKGNEVVTAVFLPKSFFPMNYAVNNMTCRQFYESFTNVEVALAPVDDVLQFLHKNHDVTYDLLGKLYSRIHSMRQHMAHLMGGSGRSRVLFELVTECKEMGKCAKDRSCELSIHEDEIAHRIGLTRESVSREISKLRNLGIVGVTRRKLTINNIRRLEQELETSF